MDVQLDAEVGGGAVGAAAARLGVDGRAAHEESDATAVFERAVGDAVAHGMDPAEVGARVVDAVPVRFWIPHP